MHTRLGTTLTRAMIPAAALIAAGLLPTGASASPAPADGSAQAAVRGVKVYDGEHFTGPNKWLNGNVGRCYYVGNGWNDAINSARTGSNRKVAVADGGEHDPAPAEEVLGRGQRVPGTGRAVPADHDRTIRQGGPLRERNQ